MDAHEHEDEQAVSPTPRLSFGNEPEAPLAAEEAQAEAMTAEAEETPTPVIETPVEASETEMLTQGNYDYTEADAGVTGDDENTYPDDRAYAAAEAEAGDVPLEEAPALASSGTSDDTDAVISTEATADTIPSADEAINEAEAVNETMNALAVPAVEAPTEEVAAVEAEEATDELVETEVAAEKTVEQLTAEREKLDAEIAAKQSLQKTGVIEQIKTVAATYGITADDIAEAMGGLKSKRKGVPAKPKYRDPATGVVWSGRGKAPAWIKDKDFSKFLI